MGLGVHVRVHAQRDRRAAAQRLRHAVQPAQFGGGLHVEAVDAGGQRLAHLGLGLSYTGEHHLAGIAAGAQHALQLAAGDDVEAGAGLSQRLQHRQVGVGLHREAHQVVHRRQRAVEGAVALQQGVARVQVQRRAMLRSEIGDRNLFGQQLAVAVGESVH